MTNREAGKPLILGMAGCSGSGKSTLARELALNFSGTRLSLDSYYRDLGHLPLEERAGANFDCPDALDTPLLLWHIAELRHGQRVEVPEYDFARHTRSPAGSASMEEHRLLVVEGNFALHFPALRAFYDFSVYVETPDEVCYLRRLLRDTRERGRSPASVLQQYIETVRPMAERYVRPSAAYADLTVDGTAALACTVEQVVGALRQRELLRAI